MNRGNPKIMVLYLALLPTLIDLARITLLPWLELTATMLLVLAAIDLGYLVLAARARLLLRSPPSLRIANRASAKRQSRARNGTAGHRARPPGSRWR
jgi:threonine/homoserine/homoserine lactone efflux protein